MAQVYHVQLQLIGQRAAVRLIREVVHEVKSGAFRILMTGPYTTGRLAMALEDEVRPTPNGATGYVQINGARHPYAASVEFGAEVHWIFPRGARGVIRFGDHSRPMLRFFWRKAGRVIYFPHIPGGPRTVGSSHPGQRGKGYLRKPLVASALRHNMRFYIVEV